MRTLNLREIGRGIAETLHAGIKAKQIVRVDVDSIRAAVVAHLAATGICIANCDYEILVDQALRIFVEKCP
jgi:hypothetical protein